MNMISAAVLLCTVPAAGQAAFGHWTEDEAGMPAYHYTGTLPFAATDEYGNPSNLPADPYFLLGNYRLSLVTHVSGIFQIVTAERMWARVNADEILPDYGSNHAILTVDSAGRHEIVELVGLNSAAADPGIASRQFGIGFARYDYSLGNGITQRFSRLPGYCCREERRGYPCEDFLQGGAAGELCVYGNADGSAADQTFRLFL